MAKMINYGKEIIRINSEKGGLEYSVTEGKTWHSRYTSSSAGEFLDLCAYGNELLAVTSKGVYYSTTAGRSWNSRYTSSSAGEFISLQDNGSELLATTSKGLYYSKNAGKAWNKK